MSSVVAEVGSIKRDMLSILRSPEWPSTASTHTVAFADWLETQFNDEATSEEKMILPKAIDGAIKTLRGVKSELEAELKTYDTSNESHSIKRTSVRVLPFVLNGFLDRRRAKVESNLGILDQQLRQASKVKPTTKSSNETMPAPESSTPTSAPEADPPAANSTSDHQSPRSWRWLDVVKVTLKTSDAVSAIPLVGSYLGAAFKAGSTVIEMLETMKDNDEVAKKMEQRFGRLSEMLDRVKNESEEPKAVEAIKVLQAELDDVVTEVQTLQPRGNAAKFISGERIATDFKDLQERVQIALQDAQAEANLTTSRIVTELYSDSLFDRLGDGNYGARATLKESAICLEGTRVALLNRIDTWIKNDETPERVLWITGSAGRGKSTVASTVAMKWKEHSPCALFHFRRGQNTLDTTLICSLAKQLARSGDMQLFESIRDKVRSNKDIAQQPLDEQFTALLVSPLAKFERKRVLIVVDALDECSAANYASAFVELVKREASSFPPNVRFLLTTRPDYPLLPILQNPNQLVENLDSEPSKEVLIDIEKYLTDGFSKIAAKRHDIPAAWPPHATVVQLAGMSEGLFQWAQTVLAFVDSRDPKIQLKRLLASPGTSTGLDKLYGQILVKAVAQAEETGLNKELLFDVLGMIVAAETPVSLEIIAFLHDGAPTLKGEDSETATSILRNDVLADVNSLLLIPPKASDPVLLAHTSIRDFLLNGERRTKQSLTSGANSETNHRRLAISCLERMNRLLKQNICELSTPSQPCSEVKDVALRRIPTGLRYCCQAWSFHLMGSGQRSASDPHMSNELVAYSTTKGLFWLEVMAALGCLSQAVEMAKDTSNWLSTIDYKSDGDSLSTLWNDVQRFASAFAEPISFNPLEIYRSALALCPTDTELWRRFQSLAQIRTVRGLHGSRWSAEVWTKAAGSRVGTVAMSPDGKLLVSGSDDKMIRLWDAHTGSQVGEALEGHTAQVTSVCFSPDGKLLASASDDETIRLWDAHTWIQLGEPLKGHTSEVKSVCFSPDGRLLASGSLDKTILMWNAHSGNQVGEPLKGHTDCVSSVCFSPDSRLLASGSHDKTIRLWEAHTRNQVGERFEGHKDEVTSICFSPDGNLLASASFDRTIRLWDANTGCQVREPLEGHTVYAMSVCFSPDGRLLASGSYDQTLRLWDAHSGNQVGEPLEGHTDCVACVCFSPDSKLLASGSYDKMIRLWDTHIGNQIGKPLEMYRDYVTSICFSPDGKLLAFGRLDKPLRLLDAQTGNQVGDPLEGHTGSVRTVCFSPDSKLLASGSTDGKIRIWEAHTGRQVGQSLERQTDDVWSFCFSPDGKLLVSWSTDGTIRLWDSQTWSQVGGHLKGHTSHIMSVCFSPDGQLLASGSTDKTIRLWNARTGSQVVERLEGHTNSVMSVCFSPDGKLLASGSLDKTIRIWDAHTGSQAGELLQGHSGHVLSVCFSLDCEQVITTSFSGVQTAWNLVTRRTTSASHHTRINSALERVKTIDPWISLPCEHLLWLSRPYWRRGNNRSLLCHGTLVVVCYEHICIFDVSRALSFMNADPTDTRSIT